MAVNFVASASYPAFNEFALSQPTLRLPVSYKILPSLSASNSQRQGVELRTSADIYNSTQAKIWSGKIRRWCNRARFLGNRYGWFWTTLIIYGHVFSI